MDHGFAFSLRNGNFAVPNPTIDGNLLPNWLMGPTLEYFRLPDFNEHALGYILLLRVWLGSLEILKLLKNSLVILSKSEALAKSSISIIFCFIRSSIH